ncbi:lysosomal acid phosphatase-like isoform X1 [Cydia splendana]|uniref:lysosomal acid phosphatase-like isoform X1 n=1 Tax=Cydia splendana TaxID=1100963 RepID=UPI0021269E00
MEYDNEENTWRRPSAQKVDRSKCNQIPKRSTTVAVVVLGLAVMSCLLGYCVLSETLPYESRTLRLVIIFFRHGARTPNTSYKTDPFKAYQWPEGLGGLTNTGKLQLYELGKKYRSYYANFIDEEYYEKDVQVRSSDKSRCLMSAATFLAGLYPPAERQIWNPELLWQPIPIHSLPTHLDNIVASTKPCKVWKAMYEELLEKSNKDAKYTKLFEYLSNHTAQDMHSVLEVDFLYSTFLSQQEAGLKIPEWTKNYFPNQMRSAFMQSLALLSHNHTLQRFKVGPLLSEMRENLEKCVSYSGEGPSPRSLLVYSGHDVNVVALWRALNYTEDLEPEYGASLVFELHEELDQGFFIKVFYRNNTKIEVPMELKLSFCEEPCRYTDFLQYIDTLIPKDWDAECQNTPH